ncbi:MAG TPA: AAA family ATPase [Phycisphaerae bacterium]|nr:AAA family ATPase [Phycisphaerae bacterium]
MAAANHRINILGASGCGASTIGRALAKELSIPHFDSDDYYHAPTDSPFQVQHSPQERYDAITADLSPQGSWVLSGGVVNWDPYPQLDFTMIVFVTTPTEIRIERLRAREYERFGDRIRRGGDMHAAHEEFIEWASRYDVGDVEGKTRQRHEAYLAEQSCPVVRIDGANPVTDSVQVICSAARSSQ